MYSETMPAGDMGFAKMGAEVLNWTLVILFGICAKLSIFASNPLLGQVPNRCRQLQSDISLWDSKTTTLWKFFPDFSAVVGVSLRRIARQRWQQQYAEQKGCWAMSLKVLTPTMAKKWRSRKPFPRPRKQVYGRTLHWLFPQQQRRKKPATQRLSVEFVQRGVGVGGMRIFFVIGAGIEPILNRRLFELFVIYMSYLWVNAKSELLKSSPHSFKNN